MIIWSRKSASINPFYMLGGRQLGRMIRLLAAAHASHPLRASFSGYL